MNNTALFLVLGGVGLYMLTKTKTSAPTTIESVATGFTTRPGVGAWVQASNGRWYPGTSANVTTTTTTSTPFNVLDILQDIPGTIKIVKDAYGNIVTAVGGHSLQTSTPTSVATSVQASVPTTTTSPSWAGIAEGEQYGGGKTFQPEGAGTDISLPAFVD